MTETVTIEKQVWKSTLNRSMVLQAENQKLKELLGECQKYFRRTDFSQKHYFGNR